MLIYLANKKNIHIFAKDERRKLYHKKNIQFFRLFSITVIYNDISDFGSISFLKTI